MKTSKASVGAKAAPAKPAKHATREAWLNAVANSLTPAFKAEGYTLPKYRITCGFPSRQATARKSRRLGECWSETASTSKHREILVSPLLDDPVEVAGVVCHELVHAALPDDTGHKGKFPVLGRAVGLEGKPKSMGAGEAFKARYGPSLKALGSYPHARMEIAGKEKKQGTRLVKVVCPCCGYTLRTTAKWLNDVGPPICPTSMEAMSVEA